MRERMLIESHKSEGWIERSPAESIKKLSHGLLDRLAALGFAVEPHPTSGRFRLTYTKTGLVLGIHGFIWSRDEIVRLVEILEEYERRLKEDENVSQDSQSLRRNEE